MFSYYTTDNTLGEKMYRAARYSMCVLHNNRIEAAINGPINTYKTNASKSIIKFSTIIDPKISCQDNNSGNMIFLKGEWSPWIHVDFEIIPLYKK